MSRTLVTLTVNTVALALASILTAATGQLVKEDLQGIRNYTRVDATVACAGATEVAAIPELKRLGFVAIVNLRQESEAEAHIAESRAAAEAAGLKYIHLPLDGGAPDPAVADAFLAAVTDPSNQPVFIHCGSANRVGALWLVKRVIRDGWTVEQATEEARAIGLRSERLEAFALQYVEEHRKDR